MANFTPKKINANSINGGQKYELGMAPSPNSINDPIEFALWMQKLTENSPIIDEINESGEPFVGITLLPDKTPAFVFRAITGCFHLKNGEGSGSVVMVEPNDANEKKSRATGRCAIALARYGRATGDYALSAGYDTEASGTYSMAFGNGNMASGDNAIAAGTSNIASGNDARAYGEKNVSSGKGATAYGKYCKASGQYSKACGLYAEASGECAIAEGNHCIARGSNSKAEGAYNETIGAGSKAYGYKNKALGTYSVVGGYASESGTEGSYSYTFAQGYGVKAPYNKTAVFGVYNNPIPKRIFTVGNGSNDENRSNAFSITEKGNCIAAKSFINNSADYAEYFEWEDGNPENEDRVGYFVTLTENGKIRKANEHDDILGVVSATPSVIGNAFEDEWQGKYLTDEWGRIQYQTVTYPAEYNEEGEQVSDERVVEEPILNPEYDVTQEYIPRSQRKEWSVVGLLGRLKVRVDGTVDKYVKCAVDGIGVYSQSGYKVLKKISNNIVEIFIK